MACAAADNPPATQWQFPAKSGAAPAFMSFRTAAREEGSNEFSISGFHPAVSAGDAFDGIKKQASLPVTPQQVRAPSSELAAATVLRALSMRFRPEAKTL
jgi:jasmonate ZIM domain-containing protein